MLPVYALTEGLPQSRLRTIIHHVVDELADEMPEVLPVSLLALRQLWPIGQALRGIHMPRDSEDVEQARRRFVYQELLALQLALALRRWNLQRSERAPALPATAKIDARIRRLFPFELTADQQQAIREIADDMGRCVPMNRLLQGEVGSGKTVVAEYAMLLAVAHTSPGRADGAHRGAGPAALPHAQRRSPPESRPHRSADRCTDRIASANNSWTPSRPVRSIC